MPQEIYNPSTDLDLYIERHKVRTGQVVLYQLDGDFADSGPNSIVLTENGTVPFAPYRELGKVIEQAAGEFTDSNYYTSTDSIFEIAGEITIMCMLYIPSGWSGEQHICMCAGPEPDTEPHNIYFRVTLNSSGYMEFLSEEGAGVDHSVVATTAVTDDQWQHLAFTRSSSGDVNLYLDGVNVGSGTLPAHTGGSIVDFTLGRNRNLAGRELEAYLSGLSIIQDELTSGDISTTANRLLGL